MADELAEINGIKPNQILADGEEIEAKSASSKAVYKIKRTFDHFYCTCPAWRNQSGVPVNARSCKHIRAALGDAYEDARLMLKNPDGPPPKSKAKPASKAKAKPASSKATKPASTRGKAKKAEDDEEGDDDDDDKPAKKTRAAKPPSSRAAKPTTTKGKRKQDEDDDDEEDAEEEEEKPVRKTRSSSKPPSSKVAKPASAKGKRKKDEDEGEEQDDEQEKPAKKARTTRSKAKPKVEEDAEMEDLQLPKRARATRGNAKKLEEVEEAEEEAEGNDDGEDDTKMAVDPSDELAEIDGIKPKKYLADGDETEAKSASSNSVYKVKRTWDHYYCTCPAWRMQSGAPVNARSCKHLKEILGDAYEAARLRLKNPDGVPPKSKGKAPASKGKAPASKGKRKNATGDDDNDDEEGEEDEDEDAPATSGKKVPDLLLANKWDIETGPDPTGWWISEKLDGVRTYFDGARMISRLGNPFTPPQWFIDKLPKDVTLDGELFGGRGEFQSTVSVVKTVNSPHWKGITFQIFDVPSLGSKPFEERLEYLAQTFGPDGTHACAHFVVVDHTKATSRDHVLEKLKEIEDLGGEGLMLRKPGSAYEGKRSGTLLKLKTFYDAEAIVTGYVPGKGRHKGSTGALKCKMASGKTFNVGSGLTDKQRRSPPSVGSIVVYRFQELTRDGVPRFPTFVGEAADKTEPKDAEVPDARKAGTAAE
ncbi:hypothetical protein JAAARDRAFT_35922 [Jaapia argillacea MUCL 33604]|uniref:SWIM-type domain-containing protein n=1 Tax=Jaapia argillacea MUCL 33604 TaxID=933084 RepID=A0A067PTW6_9AGAM|nr:hypothetical protein JAAARDRAFT_35922 [Jaapia argillacea MUCL 33604]